MEVQVEKIFLCDVIDEEMKVSQPIGVARY